MLYRLFSELIDEAVGNVLLHGFMRYRRRAAVAGPSELECPQIHSGDLPTFFSPAPTVADLQADRRRVAEADLHTVWDFSFPSEVRTAWPHSDCVRGSHWQTRAADRGLTVVAVHGIVQIGSAWFQQLAERLNPQGVDVVAMDSPFNYRRTPAGYRPGQLIMGGDLAHQLAVARQSVLDLWRLIVSLQQSGRRVGLVGVSYGGWVSLMAALLADDLDFVIALAPPVDLVRLLQEGGTVVRAIRHGLGTAPLDYDRLVRLVRPIIPSEWTPKLAGGAITLHAARYDRFVPHDRIIQLAEKWSTRLTVHDEAHFRLAVAARMIPLIADDVASRWRGLMT